MPAVKQAIPATVVHGWEALRDGFILGEGYLDLGSVIVQDRTFFVLDSKLYGKLKPHAADMAGLFKTLLGDGCVVRCWSLDDYHPKEIHKDEGVRVDWCGRFVYSWGRVGECLNTDPTCTIHGPWWGAADDPFPFQGVRLEDARKRVLFFLEKAAQARPISSCSGVWKHGTVTANCASIDRVAKAFDSFCKEELTDNGDAYRVYCGVHYYQKWITMTRVSHDPKYDGDMLAYITWSWEN